MVATMSTNGYRYFCCQPCRADTVVRPCMSVFPLLAYPSLTLILWQQHCSFQLEAVANVEIRRKGYAWSDEIPQALEWTKLDAVYLCIPLPHVK